MSKRTRQYIGILAALAAYYLVHEGAHLQYPLPEYQPIDKKQRTEKAPCRPLRAKKGDAVHIPAAEKATQDA